MQPNTQQRTPSFLARILIAIIRFYQRTLSPDHGVFASQSMRGCRYYPSCSEYMIRAIEMRGAIRGAGAGVWRILRCNPWSHGGVDDPYTEKKGSQ